MDKETPQDQDTVDWAKNAEDAQKTAEAKVEQLKQEAQQALLKKKNAFNNQK